MIIVTILVFLLVLSALVLIHEFGHFLMAKRAKIKVEEFGLGIPPRVWGKKYKGTIYSVNLLPIGGFVRLKGEDPSDKGLHDKDSFYAKSLGTRASILLAGVTMNILLGVIIFYFLMGFSNFRFVWPQFFDHKFRFADQFNGIMVEEIQKDSPAQAAGVPAFSLITRANSKAINSVDDLKSVTSSNVGSEVTLTLYDTQSGKTSEKRVVPRTDGQEKGTIGVVLSEIPFTVVQYNNPASKALVGFAHSYNLVAFNVDAFGRLIGASIARHSVVPISAGVGGPVAIAQVTGEAVSVGPAAVIEFVALLSLTLGVINVLPFPALDGGRLLFIAIEAVSRRKVNPAFEQVANTVGFFILISLIVLISFNDVVRIISGSPFGSGVFDLFKK